MENPALINSIEGVLAILCSVCMASFYLTKRYPRLFKYVPPIIWVYLIPLILTNIGVIPHQSPVYNMLKTYAIPMFIVIMLLEINIRSTVRIAGRGIGLMLIASLGVVVGSIVSFIAFKDFLPPDAWKGVGTLVGTWTGGTGNLAAVGAGLDISGETMGLAILTDTVICTFWLPLLLISKNFKHIFSKFTKTDLSHQKEIKAVAEEYSKRSKVMNYTHFVYLITIAFFVMWISSWLSGFLPEIKPVLSKATWMILLITTITILLSMTPAHKIPGTHSVATGIIYIFVASMGARAQLTNIAQAPWFLVLGATTTLIHGIFCIIGARLLKVDISIAAIASAANHGGAASAPVVAGFHDDNLVSLSIVLALVGYTIGNYLGFLTAQICYYLI